MENNFWFQEWRGKLREGRSRDELEVLGKKLEEVSLIDGEDYWICPEGPKKKFEVAWMRRLIGDRTQTQQGTNRWDKWLPKRINIMTWRIMKGRMVVKERLKKFGVDTTNTRCILCKEDEESVNHLFLNCNQALEVWRQVRKWWEVGEQRGNSIEDMLSGMISEARSSLVKRVLSLVCMVTLNAL
ncbi:hypothetical protein L1887_06642 [Cichorium endivia]|nr:hypothetical protein L1887_06642 [Cichorium endivia]